MAKRPVTALRVADVARSVQFYHHQLQFSLDRHDAHHDVAQVSPPHGVPLLLAGPRCDTVAPHMHEIFAEAPPGKRLYCFAPGSLDDYREGLLGRRAAPGEIVDGGDGGRTLELVDPDGYSVRFWEPTPMPDDRVIARVEASPRRVEEAVDGLTEAQLDLLRAPGKWSIRQLVHHMAESAANSLVRVTMAVAEPGRLFRQNPYSQDRWVANLGDDRRPIDTSVALIGAAYGHMAALVRHLDGAMDRTLDQDLAGESSVRFMLSMIAGHAEGHVAQIWETRRMHGV